MAALPGVEEEVVENVCEKLASLGVLATSDVEYIETKDIEEVLPIIQCRKLVQYFKEITQVKNSSITEEYNTQPSSSYILIDKSNPLVEKAKVIPVAPFDWAEKFEINWDDFPKEVLSACENKTRPHKKYLSEMVRMIASRIMKIDISPGRRNLRIIARKIVSKYPETFQDSVIESVIAGGVESLRNKIEECIDNKKRRAPLAETFALPEDMPQKKKRKTAKESLGCINWQPMDLPFGQTKETQQQLKCLLVAEFEKDQPDKEFVKSAMYQTYATQRFFINSMKSITEIRNEWPFLLEETYILWHFEELVGKDLLSLFRDKLPVKCKKIYEFMSCENSKKRLSECQNLIRNSKERLQNSTPEILGAFLLLLAYFEEDEKCFLQIFKVRNPVFQNFLFISIYFFNLLSSAINCLKLIKLFKIYFMMFIMKRFIRICIIVQ